VAVKKKTKDKDLDVPALKTGDKKVGSVKDTPRSVVDRTAKTRTGGADAIEAQQRLGTVAPVVSADRPEGGDVYISEQMRLYNAWLKKQKEKALGGGSGSGRDAVADKLKRQGMTLDNQLAVLKIQAEYDKADREAAKVLADAEATAQEKAEAKAERERKFASLNKVADIYKQQGEDSYKTSTERIGSLYGGQEDRLGTNRADSLDSLLKAVTASRGQIGDAEQQFLSSLVAPTAYSDVPLVDLSQSAQPNPLLGNLASEGASTAPVTAQSALDAQLAGQYAQMARNTATQLNTGNQNYMTALRNAGTGAAAAGRQELATGQNRYTNDINTRFDDLANQLAMQRMEALQRADDARNDAAVRTATAQADASQYAPTEPPEPDESDLPVLPVLPPPPDPNAVAEAERKKREREAAIAALNAARRNQF
jgi:hypothetical protein